MNLLPVRKAAQHQWHTENMTDKNGNMEQKRLVTRRFDKNG
jgi:hypothetical protein